MSIARWNLKEAGLRDEKFPMGKVLSRRTEIAYKADLGRTTLPNKKKSNATRIPYSRCGGYGMKVIVLTRGGLQGTLPSSHRSKPCRKAAVELAEVSSTHSTEEVANHHRGKGWTIRSCVKSKVNDCD